MVKKTTPFDTSTVMECRICKGEGRVEEEGNILARCPVCEGIGHVMRHVQGTVTIHSIRWAEKPMAT